MIPAQYTRKMFFTYSTNTVFWSSVSLILTLCTQITASHVTVGVNIFGSQNVLSNGNFLNLYWPFNNKYNREKQYNTSGNHTHNSDNIRVHRTNGARARDRDQTSLVYDPGNYSTCWYSRAHVRSCSRPLIVRSVGGCERWRRGERVSEGGRGRGEKRAAHNWHNARSHTHTHW